jgi:hypothetical protein
MNINYGTHGNQRNLEKFQKTKALLGFWGFPFIVSLLPSFLHSTNTS